MVCSDFAVVRKKLRLPAGAVPLVEMAPREGTGQSFEDFQRLARLFAGQGDLIMLTGPVNWREAAERYAGTPLSDPENLPLAILGYNRPDCLAASLGEGFACVALNALYRDEPEEIVTVDARGAEVPPSQRVAWLEKGEQLFALSPSYFPVIFGSEESVSMLCSYAPGEHPPTIHRTAPLRRDYSDFQHLWLGPAPQEYFGIEGLLRLWEAWDALFRACGIGKAMGQEHSRGLLNGDTHPGNFVTQKLLDTAVLIDFEHKLCLIPELTPPQCANDIAPLLPDMQRADWLAFRSGYLSTHPRGQAVVDFMERGDATGWMQAVRNNDWHRALRLADAELHPRASSKSGPDSRVKAAREQIARHELTSFPAFREDELALAFAQAMSLTGQDQDAAALFERVVSERAERLGPDHPDTKDAAAAHMAGLLLAAAPLPGRHNPPHP